MTSFSLGVRHTKVQLYLIVTAYWSCGLVQTNFLFIQWNHDNIVYLLGLSKGLNQIIHEDANHHAEPILTTIHMLVIHHCYYHHCCYFLTNQMHIQDLWHYRIFVCRVNHFVTGSKITHLALHEPFSLSIKQDNAVGQFEELAPFRFYDSW